MVLSARVRSSASRSSPTKGSRTNQRDQRPAAGRCTSDKKTTISKSNANTKNRDSEPKPQP